MPNFFTGPFNRKKSGTLPWKGLDLLAVPLFTLGDDRRIGAVNAAARRLAPEIPSQLPPGIYAAVNKTRSAHSRRVPALREWLTPSGRAFDVGNVAYDDRLIVLFDAGSRKSLSEHLSQGAKMQAVGKLVGGLAHDFNNQLTAIIGYSDMVAEKLAPPNPSLEHIYSIRKNAERASDLMRQLLAFSREQIMRPRRIKLNDAVNDTLNLVRRLVGASVRVEPALSKDLKDVEADPSQIERIIINLAINARDAMPFGGRIKIVTRNRKIASPIPCRGEMVMRGDYVEMQFEDSGQGIDGSIIEKIFDPFFTTKTPTEGTGLGLSVIDGIMRQSGGYAFAGNAASGLSGANFTLLFPAASLESKPANEERKPVEGDATYRGSATVLLAEDEEHVRLLAAKALRNAGYTVLEAGSGEEATALAEKSDFDVLVTDLVMPEMSGSDLIALLRKQKPDLPCLCISGYAESEIRDKLDLNDAVSFIAKPFRLKTLLKEVHRLNRPDGEKNPDAAPTATFDPGPISSDTLKPR